MADTLTEAVKPGDLILVHGSGDPYMVVVKSAPNPEDVSSSESSIIVKQVYWHAPYATGFFALSGPDAYYVGEGLEEDKEGARWCMSFEHSVEEPEMVFDWFSGPAQMAGSNENGETQVIVNPHGRDVLKYFFSGTCPHCGGAGWFCPGCGGVSRRWPGLFGGCAVDQSCPVCLGYNFARDDKVALRYLEELEYKLYLAKEHPDEPKMSPEELESRKNEALELTRERYESINSRRREMGMEEEDLNKILQDFKDNYL